MRPKEPHHSVTNLHRQPGGLLTLDFLIAKLNSHQQSLDVEEYKIAVIGDKNSAFSIPLALHGIEVTSFHYSEIDLQKANDFAEEVGVFVINKLGNLSDQDKLFDAIVNLDENGEVGDISYTVKQSLDRLKPNGRLFFKFAKKILNKKSRKYKLIINSLLQAKLLPINCKPTSLLLKSFYDSSQRHRIKRGGNLFHVLDFIDSKLSASLPRSLSSTWMFECIKGSDEPLVVQLLPTLSAGGGAERLAVQLAELVPKYGYSSLVISMVKGGGLEKVLQEKQIPYLILERSSPWDRITILIKLIRIFKDLKPTLVHTHLFASDFWGRIAARLARVKIITTVHNVKTQFNKIGELIMQAMSSFSDQYIAISADVNNYLVKYLKIKPKQITTISNGIDLSSLRVRSNRAVHDIPKLIFVGRLEKQKAPLLLIEALRHVTGPWELSVFGDGSLGESMRRLAEEYNLTSRIRFMGVSNKLYHQYADYDLFILPSLWEGFGLAAIEAAAVHLPMIVSDLPVMHELFNENEVVFIKPGNSESLSLAIQKVLTNRELVTSLSQHLSNRDFSDFSISHMIQGYTVVYKNIVK
ncbi:glycosyltransferase [Patescibacteria group bacterium]|nr:glycosyltransferase [Patescibacteria group bacterium]